MLRKLHFWPFRPDMCITSICPFGEYSNTRPKATLWNHQSRQVNDSSACQTCEISGRQKTQCCDKSKAVRVAVETVSYPLRTTRTISRGKHISLDKNHEAERTEMGKSTIRQLLRNSAW